MRNFAGSGWLLIVGALFLVGCEPTESQRVLDNKKYREVEIERTDDEAFQWAKEFCGNTEVQLFRPRGEFRAEVKCMNGRTAYVPLKTVKEKKDELPVQE